MVSVHKANTQKTIHTIRYRGQDHVGPASIYRSAAYTPSVSFQAFSSRLRRLADKGLLSEARIDECLSLNIEDFKRKYAIRKTMILVDGEQTDLHAFYLSNPTVAGIKYSNFRQRICAIEKTGITTREHLFDALTLTPPEWKSFYGGGRRKGFVYNGDEYPLYAGKYFHSLAAFLRTIDRYDDRALIWSRLKSDWNLDDALVVPTAFGSHRAGLIYRVTRRKTGELYVGLTVTTLEQRWVFHVRRAKQGSTTKFHLAIQEDGPNGFDLDILESGISDPVTLRAREIYWAEHLEAFGPKGLNSAKAGGLGSPRGKSTQYDNEVFRSIAEATHVLSQRRGIAPHVINKRIKDGRPIPDADRVRRHSRHPDAGSNLFRRWLALNRRYPAGVLEIWAENYDNFKADVSPVPSGMELVRKASDQPWGPGNVEWVNVKTKIERVHGKTVHLNGVAYPSLKEVAKAYGLGVSTLKHRIGSRGMSLEEAVTAPLSATSYKKSIDPVVVDGKIFRSANQAINYIAQTRGWTIHQAKYRYSTGKY